MSYHIHFYTIIVDSNVKIIINNYPSLYLKLITPNYFFKRKIVIFLATCFCITIRYVRYVSIIIMLPDIEEIQQQIIQQILTRKQRGMKNKLFIIDRFRSEYLGDGISGVDLTAFNNGILVRNDEFFIKDRDFSNILEFMSGIIIPQVVSPTTLN